MNEQVHDQFFNKKMKKFLALFICIQIVISSLLTGCSSGSEQVITKEDAESTVIMTIEDYQVSLDEVYLYLIQYFYNSKSSSASIDDATAETIMNAVVEELKLEVVEYLLAINTEVEVSDAELETAESSAQIFYDHFGEEFLSCYGIDYECVNDLFVRQAYINALNNKAVVDMTEDYTVQLQEEYKDLVFHSVYYALFPSVQYDEEGNPVTDGDGNYIALSEEEMKAQYALAEELRGRAIEGIASGTAGETMEELVVEYGIDYCSGIERNYDGAYSQELNDVIASMAEGDISEVVTTDAGYMVVRMDTLDDQEYKEYMISYLARQSANNLLPTMQDNWVTQSGVSSVAADEKVLDSVDPASLCKDMEKRELF